MRRHEFSFFIGACLVRFWRAMLCISAASAVVRWMGGCLSVRHVRVLCQNG